MDRISSGCGSGSGSVLGSGSGVDATVVKVDVTRVLWASSDVLTPCDSCGTDSVTNWFMDTSEVYDVKNWSEWLVDAPVGLLPWKSPDDAPISVVSWPSVGVVVGAGIARCKNSICISILHRVHNGRCINE